MEEDKKAEEERLRQIIKERKAKAALEAEKEAILAEKKRREEGKLLQESAKQFEQIKREEGKQQAKDKQKDLEYQKALREQVRREKEERMLKSQELSSSGVSASTTPSMDTSTNTDANTTASPAGTPRTAIQGDVSVLRVRLLNGNSFVEQFDSSTTLGNVMNTLNEKHQITERYHFKMTFPNKTFTKEDEDQTLSQLNLVPNASLVMTQAPDAKRQTNRTILDQSNVSFIQLIWNFIMSWIYWFIGIAPTTTTDHSNQPSSSSWGPKGKVNHVNSVSEYNQLRNTNDLVIVDISATWCGPCKKIAPFFDQLARENPTVLFLHVDLDKFKNSLSDLSNVRSVPTFLFFKNKRLVNTIKGAKQQDLGAAVRQYK